MKNETPTILFSSKEALEWFEFIRKNWYPLTGKVVLIPCSSKKPYHSSVTHAFFSKLWRLWRDGKIDLVIVSEPLTVVPAEFDFPEPKYPLYEYPPSFIKQENGIAKKERKIWRERMKIFLRRNSAEYFFILYPYHRLILGDILENHAQGYYTTRPYIARTVEKILKVILEKANQRKKTFS